MRKHGFRWGALALGLALTASLTFATPTSAVVTGTADYPDDVDLNLTGIGLVLQILAGSSSASLEIASGSFTVEVAAGEHFTFRYNGPNPKTMPNDGGVTDCNNVGGNNVITVNGPTSAPITFIPSPTVICTLGGGRTGGGGGGGGGSLSPSINLTAANGGETLNAGQLYSILWQSAGTFTGVKISLSTDGGATYPTIIAASTYNTGSYTWLVPDLDTDTARIKVEGLGTGGVALAMDTSNAVFAIKPAPLPPLTVAMSEPATGDVIAGSVALVALTSRAVQAVDFILTSPAGTPITVAATADVAKMTWTGIWNSKSSPNGAYSILTKAYGTAEQKAAGTAESTYGPIIATLNNPVYSTVVSVTLPSTGTKLYGQVKLTATTSLKADAVKFILTPLSGYSGTTPIEIAAAAATTSGKTWNASWDSRAAGNGSYSLVARATTGGATAGESDPLTVSVTNWPKAIAVLVYVPLSTQAEPKIAHLSAVTDFAADRVQFVISSAAGTIAQVDASADVAGKAWTGAWDVTNVEAGQYSVKARALMDSTQLGVSIDLKFLLPLAVPEGSLTSTESAAPLTDQYRTGTFSSSSAFLGTPTINVDKGLLTPPATPLLFKPGALIKNRLNPAVYYYARDGKRYVFPNAQIYHSWYVDFSSVLVVSDAMLSSIPIGGNVTYRPGALMLKIQSDPKVYAVARGGWLRWVSTEAVAKALYGDNWNQKIHDVPDAFFFNYQIGDPITDANLPASGGSY